jgi:uncharacterized membrane protein YeaQ/YmgE (transglycosylase-associated protein family)
MSILTILGWIVAGLIIGALARLIMPGRDPMGMLATMLLGIAGAVAGGLLGRGLGLYGQYDGAGWIMSIVGALLVLAGYRMVVGSRYGTGLGPTR